MDKPENLTSNRLLFDLAARLGSLEGYLYTKEKVEKSYLPGWLANIDREFRMLPPEIRSEIQQDYLLLLKRVQTLLLQAYGDQDSLTKEIAVMISKSSI